MADTSCSLIVDGADWIIRAPRDADGNKIPVSDAEDGWSPEGIGLLEALSTTDAKWRSGFLKRMQTRPFKARLSLRGRRIDLEPDPRYLHSSIWKLTAELVAGGWPVRKCAAPGCGKYIGQWTKRERLFCDDGCRAAYHNAKRRQEAPAAARSAVPKIVPASTRNRPRSTPRQPTRQRKTPR